MSDERDTDGVLHWRGKQQKLCAEEGAEVERLELFKFDVALRVVHEILGFNPRGKIGGGEVAGSIVFLALVGTWVATVVTCLTEREMRGGQ